MTFIYQFINYELTNTCKFHRSFNQLLLCVTFFSNIILFSPIYIVSGAIYINYEIMIMILKLENGHA
jgi:hypothetical protein